MEQPEKYGVIMQYVFAVLFIICGFSAVFNGGMTGNSGFIVGGLVVALLLGGGLLCEASINAKKLKKNK